MAIAATTTWEVRGTGSDSNGGGFDPGVASPGTDYSQQDAAQIAYTDLVIDGVDNTKLTSAAHPFTSAHPGNIINITGGAGFTAGWYEILSVSGITATMDRAVGTVGSTGGTGNLGGALVSPGQAVSLSVGANIIYVKRQAGDTPYAFSNTANISGGRLQFDNAGTSDNHPTMLIGYDTNRTTKNTDSPPIFKPAADGFHAVVRLNNTYQRVHNVKILNPDSHTSANFAIFEMWSLYNLASRVYVDWNSAGGLFSGFYFNSNETTAFDCYAANCGNVGYYNNATTVVTSIDCVSKNNTNLGWGFGPFRCIRCVAIGTIGTVTVGDGFNFGSNAGGELIQCVAYGNGRNGFMLYYDTHAINCIATNNGTAGNGYGFREITLNNAPVAILAGCGTFNNQQGGISAGFADYSQINCFTMSGDPFTNAAGDDFSLNNTAGAGATARAAGWPTSIYGLSTNNYTDSGAAQHADTPGTYTTVSSNHQPATPGQSVTFTAAVTVVGGGTATGTIQFVIDGVNFGAPVALVAGSATSGATTTLATGTRTITAVYAPSGSFQASTGTLYQVVQTAGTPVTPISVARLFRTNWRTDPEGFAQELAILATTDPNLSGSANVLRDILPQML